MQPAPPACGSLFAASDTCIRAADACTRAARAEAAVRQQPHQQPPSSATHRLRHGLHTVDVERSRRRAALAQPAATVSMVAGTRTLPDHTILHPRHTHTYTIHLRILAARVYDIMHTVIIAGC